MIYAKSCLLSILTTLCLSLTTQAEAVPIFDGKTLNGWQGTPGVWRIEDGAITASIDAGKRLHRNEFIFYKEELADFELTLQYRITGHPTANSGIQIRSKRHGKHSAAGYQCDLDDGKQWLGRIYDEHGRRLILERGTLTKISPQGKRSAIPFATPGSFTQYAKKDDWNTYRIIARGHRIEIHINGIHFSTLEDYEKGQYDLKGLVALQIHSGVGPVKIQFKDIRLKKFVQQIQQDSPAKDKAVEALSIIPKDAPNIGFEKGNLSGWKTKGNAWRNQPIKGDASAKRGAGVSNHQGEHWLGGYEVDRNDKATGTLTSTPFKITHPWASFLVGGGRHQGTRVEILTESSQTPIFTASGSNKEAMRRVSVDLRKHIGKRIVVRLIDEVSGGWGHINYDDFRFHNKKPAFESVAGGSGRLTSSPLLWGLKKNPNQDDSTATARGMFVPEGFEVTTIASEPRLIQPIAFDFDAKGRIWVVESPDYPRKPKPGQGKDRILIFEDKNGDGSFETRKIFADKLSLVSGIAVGYGGVFVGSAPDIYFIPDKNGDDKPDGKPQVLITGFSTRDTHETPNSFMWGNDGWLYGCHGMYNPCWVGKPGATKEEKTYIESAVWRLHPVTHKFEIYANGGSNQWGLAYNQHGDMFMTHCRSAWGLGPVSQVFRDGHYWAQENKNHRDFIAAPPKGYRAYTIGENNFFTSIAAYGHGEGGAGKGGSKAIFGGHSHCGTMIYLGDNWPDEYRGNLFTNNLHGSQLNREMLVKKDSAYLSYSHGQDSLYSPDPEYLGVHVKYGPDGAVYISDWADRQQCHNNRFEIWNRTNGRIYRMAWQDTYKPVKIDLTKEPSVDLLKYLSHKNEWYPHMAQHILRQRKAAGKDLSAVAEKLRIYLLNPNNPHRFRALTALQATGGINTETFRTLLNDKDEHIVKLTLTYLTEHPAEKTKTFGPQLIELAKSTPHPTVRLHLALAAQHRLDEQIAKPIIEALAMNETDANDRFIGKAVWYAYSKFANQDKQAALNLAAKTPLHSLRRSIFWNHAKSDLSGAMAHALKLTDDSAAADAVSMIALLYERTKKLDIPAEWAALKNRALKSNNHGIKRHVQILDDRFKGGAILEKKIPSKGKPIANARKINIDAAKGLKYAQELITVKPGEGLQIIFDNKDGIPHNLVLIRPGSSDKVGTAADKLAADPNAIKNHYVPEMPEVIEFTPVLNASEAFIIHMRAPSQPGDYPYICTFPGHWRVMKGILRVK